MKTLLLLISFLLAISLQSAQDKKPSLYISGKNTFKLSKEYSVLPVWVAASDSAVDSVRLKVPGIISSDGVLKTVRTSIDPASGNTRVSKEGRLFKIKMDSIATGNLESGTYTVILILSGYHVEPVKETLIFGIAPSKNVFSIIKSGINWLLDNFFVFVWNLFQALLLLLIFIFIIKLVYSLIRINKKDSLNVLPIINETGKEEDYKGASEGIDDILIYRLQEISRLNSKEAAEKNKQLRVTQVPNDRDKENVQRLNVVGGEFSMDLQKIGDITIGPVKIPLGSISGLLIKLFGGNFVSGALQKYGKQHKLYIKLERKSSVFSFKKLPQGFTTIQYFEAGWISETKDGNSTEGVLEAVDELAYKLILELSENVETKDWLAYKYFQNGYKLFSDYEINKTRIDLLRDAISLWLESVKCDPGFAKAHYNLGVAYDLDGRLEDAIFYYQRAITLQPKLIGAEAHFNLARIFWEKYKDSNRTLSELEKAKEIDAEIPDIYNLEGLVYSGKSGSYAAEEQLYQKAINLSQKNPNPIFYYNLCAADYYLNKFDQAQAAGEISYKLYGDEVKFNDLLQTMGVIHFQKGINAENTGDKINADLEFQKSAKYYAEGLCNKPEKRDLLHGYRDVLFKLGRNNEGIETLKRLIRLYPEEPVSYLNISKYLKSANINSEEIKVYELIASILQNERDPLKYCSEFLKTDESIVKTKIFRGVLASIYNLLYDQDVYPDFLNNSLSLFEEIFQTEYDSVSTMIDAGLLHHFGMVLYKSGNYEKSLGYFNQAIKGYENAGCIYDLAQAYSDLARGYRNYIEQQFQKYTNAQKIENRLIGTEGTSETDITEAVKTTDRLFNEVSDLIFQADSVYQKSSYNYQKSGFLNQAVSAHLDNAEFLTNNLSYIIYGNKVFDLAKMECDKAIQIDHKNFNTYLVKGTTFYNSRQYLKAIPEYEKSIALNFNLKATHYNIGLCNYYLGNFKEAANAFQTVIKLDPKYTSPDDMSSPDAYQRLALCLEKLVDINGAVKVLNNAADLHPLKVKYHIILGQLYKRNIDLAKAASELNYAITLDKDNKQKMQHVALIELADILIDKCTNVNKAETLIRKARKIIKDLNLEPDGELLALLENTEGWIYYYQNNYESAISSFEKTLIDFLNDPKYHIRLAYVYEKYADSLSDPVEKDIYLRKALCQWKIIINLNIDDHTKNIAKEKLNKLAKIKEDA